jgi:hypothetical protein
MLANGLNNDAVEYQPIWSMKLLLPLLTLVSIARYALISPFGIIDKQYSINSHIQLIV